MHETNPFESPSEVDVKEQTRSTSRVRLAAGCLILTLAVSALLLTSRSKASREAAEIEAIPTSEVASEVDDTVSLSEAIQQYGGDRGGAHVILDDGDIGFITDSGDATVIEHTVAP